MSVREAYDQWSTQYDTNRNRTRDHEAVALRDALDRFTFQRVLEIGCGTGKNTFWLATRATHLDAIDLSPGMLNEARAKVQAPHVHFMQADVLSPWSFVNGRYDLVTFSLVLEHIEDLDVMMRNAADALAPGGLVYLGELHPFKQYVGTKARFETEQGTQVVTCHTHHLSDHVRAARRAGLVVEDVREHFDAEDATAPPRILVLLLRKPVN